MKIKNYTQERARLYTHVSPAKASSHAVHQPPAACPHGSSWADSLGPPELPCPESGEPGALRIGCFPDCPSEELPEQSVQLPRAGALSCAFFLQALRGQAEASLSTDTSQPTGLTLLSCVGPRASSPLQDPRPSSEQTRSGLPHHPGFPGRRVGTGGSSQDRGLSGMGPPSQRSPEPQDVPKVTLGGGGAGSQPGPPTSSAAPPAAGVDAPRLPSTEASPARRPQANTGRGGGGWRGGCGGGAASPDSTCRGCVTAAGHAPADRPAPPSLTRAGPMRRGPMLALAVSRMHGALAAWAGP